MSKYPSYDDSKFNTKIEKVFNAYKIHKKKQTMEDICFPKKYTLQKPQQFLGEFINPKTPYKGLIVYHRIGAGKTCGAIQIGEKWKDKKKIVVVLPASLKGNFRTELRSLCAGENYMTNKEREALGKLQPKDAAYKEIIKKSDERINKYYDIYSYNKFVELINGKEITLKNAILIIDEIQNMISEFGNFYKALYDIIHNSTKDLRVVLLSATPMFDKPNEIALTVNLLRPHNKLPVGNEFDATFIKTVKRPNGTYMHTMTNENKFKKMIKGYISYFRGAPEFVFPEMKIKYVKCEMSSFQTKAYHSIMGNEENNNYISKKKLSKNLNVSDLPNEFYIGTRMISNIVFPNKKINEEGYESLTDKMILKNLENFSIKFHTIINKVKNASGKIFIYSSFKEYGGIKSFVRVLEAHGYQNYIGNGAGAMRYAVWSGDESLNTKEEIRAVYNNKNNIAGNKIKILLGSPSIKEGISLSSVRQVHILEPYWNMSRIDQIIGRASRYCSHKDLAEEERTVKVYIYIAVFPNSDSGKDKEKTVDQYIQQIAIDKQHIIKSFEKSIKEVAVDCKLNLLANRDDGPITCDN
jgi:hypothetical protein